MVRFSFGLGFGGLFRFQPDLARWRFLEDLDGGGHGADLVTPSTGGDFHLGVALGQRLHRPGHGLNGAGNGPRQAKAQRAPNSQSYGEAAPAEPAGGTELFRDLLLKLGLVVFWLARSLG